MGPSVGVDARRAATSATYSGGRSVDIAFGIDPSRQGPSPRNQNQGAPPAA